MRARSFLECSLQRELRALCVFSSNPGLPRVEVQRQKTQQWPLRMIKKKVAGPSVALSARAGPGLLNLWASVMRTALSEKACVLCNL